MLPSCLFAAPRYARVLFGANELSLSQKAIVDGKSVYAPVDVLKALGFDYAAGEHKATLALDGRTVDINVSKHQGVAMVDLEEVARALDAEYSWDEESSTAVFFSKLLSVEFKDSVLTAKLSLPAAASSDRLWNPSGNYGWRVSFDLPGVKLATDSKSYDVSGASVKQIRLGQFTENTARIVLDLSRNVGYKVLTNGANREIKISVGDGKPDSAPAKVTPVPDKVKPVNITDIKIEPDGESRVIIKIATSGRPTAKAYLVGMPHRLIVDVEKGVLVTPNENIPADHPLLKGIRTGQQSGLARISCDVSRLVIYDTVVDASGITLKLALPAGSGGKLKDKVIVVDAGHGGAAKGAVSCGTMEKDVNLLMAQQVKAALEAAGARVIMTRDGDADLGLTARPKVADDCCADFFISLHCNSNTVPDSASGVETYYHFDQLSSKTLATAVHDRVIELTGMKDLRARSDGTLYDSGLAVLRNANVPAILVECGYINSSRDRSLLCDESYRDKVAQAIVEGLRDYVEGKTNQEGNQ